MLNESVNGKLHGELPDREIFYTLAEAQVLIERWLIHYNQHCPHTSLAAETMQRRYAGNGGFV